MTNGARHKGRCGTARVEDISIPMNGSYQLTIIDIKTKQKYTIGLDVVSNVTRGCPVMVNGSYVRPYRKKDSTPLIVGMRERKERLSVGIEKKF